MLEIKVDELKERIIKEVKNDKVEQVFIDDKGKIIFKTKWYTYKCEIKDNGSFKLGGGANGVLLGLAIVGLFTIVPLVFVIFIGIKEGSVMKDLKKQIKEIVQ